MIPDVYIATVLILWSLPVLAWAVPRVVDAQRDAIRSMGGATFVLMMMLVAFLTVTVGRAIADKGGGTETNEPPAACVPSVQVINLIERDGGRLVPVGVSIKRKETP